MGVRGPLAGSLFLLNAHRRTTCGIARSSDSRSAGRATACHRLSDRLMAAFIIGRTLCSTPKNGTRAACNGADTSADRRCTRLLMRPLHRRASRIYRPILMIAWRLTASAPSSAMQPARTPDQHAPGRAISRSGRPLQRTGQGLRALRVDVRWDTRHHLGLSLARPYNSAITSRRYRRACFATTAAEFQKLGCRAPRLSI